MGSSSHHIHWISSYIVLNASMGSGKNVYTSYPINDQYSYDPPRVGPWQGHAYGDLE